MSSGNHGPNLAPQAAMFDSDYIPGGQVVADGAESPIPVAPGIAPIQSSLDSEDVSLSPPSQPQSSDTFLATTSSTYQASSQSSDTVQPTPFFFSVPTYYATAINLTVLFPTSSIVSDPVSSAFVAVPTDSISNSSSSSQISIDTSSTITSLPASTPSSYSDPATATASESSVPAPQTYLAHSPPFYVGIVLGAIAFIAILAAFVAWWIRIRSHARRRKDETIVPWANQNIGDENRETGNRSNNNAAIGVMHLGGSREDFANSQAWQPTGDRDVGEPKRSDSYNDPSRPTPAPIHDYYTGEIGRNYGQFHPSSVHPAGSGNPFQNNSVTPSYDDPLPSPFSLESPTSGLQLNLNDVYGTPREALDQPRFLSLRGDGLNVPWRASGDSSAINSRLKTIARKDTEGSQEGLSPTQTPVSGENTMDLEKAEDGIATNTEGWSSSLKLNLINAFNAVASNLTALGGAEEKEDILTPIPTKRGTTRKSVRGGVWEDTADMQVDRLSPRRQNTTVSDSPSLWTLEEVRDGAGIVHIRPPGSEYKLDDNTVAPELPMNSLLSLADSTSALSVGSKQGDITRIPTHESQTPLIIRKKPQQALLRPDNLFRQVSQTGKGISLSVGSGILSRASSIYSTASGLSVSDKGDKPQAASSAPGNRTAKRKVSTQQTERPEPPSRLSSVCSAVSSVSCSSQGIVAAQKALRDRREKSSAM